MKTAKEYREQTQAAINGNHTEWTGQVKAFIESDVQKAIEEAVTNKKFACGVPVMAYPSDTFIEEIKHQLEPMGFTVKHSHDGGGMYAVAHISWAPKDSKLGWISPSVKRQQMPEEQD